MISETEKLLAKAILNKIQKSGLITLAQQDKIVEKY